MSVRAMAKSTESPRIISEAELKQEGARRTVTCTNCRKWIRYVESDRVTDPDGKRRFVLCPGCGCERVLAISTCGGL